MTSSMTAFARAECEEEIGRFVWEVRSVNHRYLDVHLKLPEEFRRVEAQFRENLTQRFQRGRIEASLRFSRTPAQSGLGIDAQMVQHLAELGEQVSSQYALSRGLSAIDILQWPGVVEPATTDSDLLSHHALESFQIALDKLSERRGLEGQNLAKTLHERVGQMSEIVHGLRQKLPELIEDQRERMEKRVAELSIEIDEQRLSQELALLLQKSDIAEELDRLKSHLSDVDSILSKDGPKGRRLDFIMQELNREANTLGAKSATTAQTQAAIELKVLTEQMREQVQNIE